MGLQVPMNRDPRNIMTLEDKLYRLPKSVDYRKKGMVTPVKDQVRAKNWKVMASTVCEVTKFEFK